MSNPRRIYAIDVLRGITISLMILVNNPGSWSYVYGPFLHAKWHGCTLTDLVFPFFLFLVGASMRFSFVRWHDFASKKFYQHVFWRTLSIFIVGLLLNAYPFVKQDWDWSDFRFMGVLQRIALAYGISAVIIIHNDLRDLIKILFGILLFYWGAMWLGDTGNPYGLESNLVRKIDIFILGEKHLYNGFGVRFDPEGLFSTLTSVSTVIIGYLIGGMLHTTKNYLDCVKRTISFGFILMIIGYFWGYIFPINKALWTSSYVLLTSGIASISFGILIFFIDVKSWKKPFWFFEIFGTNSIFIFVASGLWAKTMLSIKLQLDGNLVSSYSYLYQTLFVPIAGKMNGSLLFAVTHIFAFWILLYWMHRKNIKIKL